MKLINCLFDSDSHANSIQVKFLSHSLLISVSALFVESAVSYNTGQIYPTESGRSSCAPPSSY